MFAWCDPALAKEGKCDPTGLNDQSLPGECAMWQSPEGEVLLQLLGMVDWKGTIDSVLIADGHTICPWHVFSCSHNHRTVLHRKGGGLGELAQRNHRGPRPSQGVMHQPTPTCATGAGFLPNHPGVILRHTNIPPLPFHPLFVIPHTTCSPPGHFPSCHVTGFHDPSPCCMPPLSMTLRGRPTLTLLLPWCSNMVPLPSQPVCTSIFSCSNNLRQPMRYRPGSAMKWKQESEVSGNGSAERYQGAKVVSQLQFRSWGQVQRGVSTQT